MQDYTVKSVDKACNLLEVVSNYPDGVSITELAQQIGMYKSTVHRLLSTLIKHGLIEQNEHTGKYKLGYGLLDLGMKLLSSIDLRREAFPFLKQLAAESNEVVHLALRDQGEIVYVEKVEGMNNIRMHSRIGGRVPIHATGLGKVLLAFLPRAEALAILDRYGMPSLTQHTITNRGEFLRCLDETRERGYGIDIEENQAGICCVAAPIWDNTKQVVAAVSVSGPISMLKERLLELAPSVIRTGVQISERLGVPALFKGDVRAF